MVCVDECADLVPVVVDWRHQPPCRLSFRWCHRFSLFVFLHFNHLIWHRQWNQIKNGTLLAVFLGFFFLSRRPIKGFGVVTIIIIIIIITRNDIDLLAIFSFPSSTFDNKKKRRDETGRDVFDNDTDDNDYQHKRTTHVERQQRIHRDEYRHIFDEMMRWWKCWWQPSIYFRRQRNSSLSCRSVSLGN